MKVIKTANYIKEAKKKNWDPNPWAVCEDSVGKKKDPKKFERCVMDVKEKQQSSLNELKTSRVGRLQTRRGLENENPGNMSDKEYRTWFFNKLKEQEESKEDRLRRLQEKARGVFGGAKKIEKLGVGGFDKWCKKNGFPGECTSCAKLALSNENPQVRNMGAFYFNTKK